MGDRDGNRVRGGKQHRKEVSFAPDLAPGAKESDKAGGKAASPPKLGPRKEETSSPSSPRSPSHPTGKTLPPSSSASPPASPGRAPGETSAGSPSLKLSAADLRLQAPLEFTTSQQRREQLRAFLGTLGDNEIKDLPFRDLKNDMAAWGRQFQAALAPAMYRARSNLLEALAMEASHATESANPERRLQRIVRTGRAVAAELRPPGFHMPPLAMMMLAEAREALAAQPRIQNRKANAIETICADAVRNLLIQNGFLSSLTSGLTGPVTATAYKVITYVKAVFGMIGTSQGETAAIVRNVENDDREAANYFITKICKSVASVAPAVEIHWPHEDMDGDSAAAKEHAEVKRRLFIDTWDKRGRKSVEFRYRGLCHFLDTDGRFKAWNDPASLAEWLGGDPSDPLPEVIIHVAGPQLLRYVREYLLGGERGKELGLRPGAEFKPELSVLLRRDGDEFVLDFRAVDDDFNRKGLASTTDLEESDAIIESDDEEAADTRKVHLEVRLQMRFRRPDLFQMHSALIVKAEY